jgi:hypothetical protein
MLVDGGLHVDKSFLEVLESKGTNVCDVDVGDVIDRAKRNHGSLSAK